MSKLNTVVLIFILLLAFCLRIYGINSVPPALNWDEVSIGYNAYSILKTGKDEWGKQFPVHFQAYGEYKLPMQIYLSIPGIYFFGLSELGIRITPIIYGLLTVLVMYFLGKELFVSRLVGLVSAFLLAISPWHIQLTRGSFESSLATFFIVLGVWFLARGFRKNKWFVISMIPFALSVFTYNTTRIFTPMFLFSIAFLYRKVLIRSKEILICSVILFTILLLPLAPYAFSGDRSSRYKLVSITDDPGLIPRINENRGKSKLIQPLPRLVHNKITYVSFYFVRNYLAHFSPQFLFISGAPHRQHHVQNMGELYLFQAPFLVIGIIGLFKTKQRFTKLLFSWLLLAFIPVSVTGDSIPHALRTLIAAPFYQLVSAFGFFITINFVRRYSIRTKVVLLCTLLIIVLISVGYYLNQYYNVYPRNYSRDWQYGYKQAVTYIKNNQDKYDEIVFTRHYGEPHMFMLFFLGFDPGRYQTDPNLNRFETFDWVRVLRFDKYYFPDLGDRGTRFEDIVKENPNKKLLFVGRSGDFPKDTTRLFSIDFLNGEDAFDIVEAGSR